MLLCSLTKMLFSASVKVQTKHKFPLLPFFVCSQIFSFAFLTFDPLCCISFIIVTHTWFIILAILPFSQSLFATLHRLIKTFSSDVSRLSFQSLRSKIWNFLARCLFILPMWLESHNSCCCWSMLWSITFQSYVFMSFEEITFFWLLPL